MTIDTYNNAWEIRDKIRKLYDIKWLVENCRCIENCLICGKLIRDTGQASVINSTSIDENICNLFVEIIDSEIAKLEKEFESL